MANQERLEILKQGSKTAHKKLDEAFFAAYGWRPDLGGEEILEKLSSMNLERGK